MARRDFIPLTPGWEGVAPIIIAAIEHGTPKGQQIGRDQVTSLARGMDAVTKALTEIVSATLWHEGTGEQLQIIIDLCLKASSDFGITREEA